MLRHKGKNRTVAHNLRLAIMLSFVAGMVNICGVLHVGTLTTNVTGHFAFFAEQLVGGNYRQALVFLVYIGAFLAGAFTSGFLVEFVGLRKPVYSHLAPLLMELVLLILTGLGFLSGKAPAFLAAVLLFAMGLQNALVTRVSSSVVRTTHLTGLFTDLGIEMSQLFFYRDGSDRKKLKSSLLLRMMIIVSFFCGGVSGGFSYLRVGLTTLLFASFILFCALIYDNVRYRFYFLRRKIRQRQGLLDGR